MGRVDGAVQWHAGSCAKEHAPHYSSGAQLSAHAQLSSAIREHLASDVECITASPGLVWA